MIILVRNFEFFDDDNLGRFTENLNFLGDVSSCIGLDKLKRLCLGKVDLPESSYLWRGLWKTAARNYYSRTIQTLIEKFPSDLFEAFVYATWNQEMQLAIDKKLSSWVETVCERIERIIQSLEDPTKLTERCRNMLRRIERFFEVELPRLDIEMEEYAEGYYSPDALIEFTPIRADAIVHAFVMAVIFAAVMTIVVASLPAALAAVAAATATTAVKGAAVTAALVVIVTNVVEGGVDHTNPDAIIAAVQADPEFKSLTREVANNVIEELESSLFPVVCDEIRQAVDDQILSLEAANDQSVIERCEDSEYTLAVLEEDAIECSYEHEIDRLIKLIDQRCSGGGGSDPLRITPGAQ